MNAMDRCRENAVSLVGAACRACLLSILASCSTSDGSSSPDSGTNAVDGSVAVDSEAMPDSGSSIDGTLAESGTDEGGTSDDAGTAASADGGDEAAAPSADASVDSGDASDASPEAGDATTLDVGLLAYYPSNGDTLDHSGNGNHCTLVGTGGTFTTDHQGNTAAAYQLENNAYLDCGGLSSLDATSDVTVSAWINADPASLTGTNRLVIGDHAIPYLLGIENQNLAQSGPCNMTGGPLFGSAGQVLCSPTTIGPSTWHQVVGLVRGSFVGLYLDGVEVQSSTQGVTPTTFTGSLHLYIGRNSGTGFAAYYQGALDEIRIYGRALSSTELAALP